MSPGVVWAKNPEGRRGGLIDLSNQPKRSRPGAGLSRLCRSPRVQDSTWHIVGAP